MKSGRHFLIYFTGVATAWLVLLSIMGMALGHWVPRSERRTAAVIEEEKEVVGEAPQELVSVVNESAEQATVEQPPLRSVQEPESKRPEVVRVAAVVALRQEETRRPLREIGETNQVPRPEAPPVNDPACAAVPGTAVEFVKNPLTAFKLAAAESKLVFMIHLSGNFEDKGFT